MEKKKVFSALRATTLAALCAGGLMLATTACCTAGKGEKSCGGDAGAKSCGDKSCGDKSCGDKSCGDKSCGGKESGN